ncbi:hypothetical protein PHMEG_00012772 [Phytophthora megakarya]|uniref:Multidrug resistance protein ABC transporter n=1 Tax=Phytophthora megakarya TaxID=4795 RepID=A0A225W8E4_9STRA|nr:hypothetical protein PHMEG_00012772 [Phytophthora megakarya]
MSSSSDSDDGKFKRKSFKIGSSGTPVRWNGEDWTFYKHAMMNAFEKSLLDEIALGKEVKDENWDDEKKGEFKKKQAKIKILIQGSLSMKLAKQVMMKETGTEMWAELVDIYEGKTNPAMTAQKVYRLQCELHKTHLRGKDDLRSHLYKLFDIKNKLADLGAPVNDLQMVDKMLRSLPAQTCYDELRRKVLFSSNMAKYTLELVRELILTAEARNKTGKETHLEINLVRRVRTQRADLSKDRRSRARRANQSRKPVRPRLSVLIVVKWVTTKVIVRRWTKRNPVDGKGLKRNTHDQARKSQ